MKTTETMTTPGGVRAKLIHAPGSTRCLWRDEAEVWRLLVLPPKDDPGWSRERVAKCIDQRAAR